MFQCFKFFGYSCIKQLIFTSMLLHNFVPWQEINVDIFYEKTNQSRSLVLHLLQQLTIATHFIADILENVSMYFFCSSQELRPKSGCLTVAPRPVSGYFHSREEPGQFVQPQQAILNCWGLYSKYGWHAGVKRTAPLSGRVRGELPAAWQGPADVSAITWMQLQLPLQGHPLTIL